MEISKLFDNILDLPGIEGVCLFGTEGQMYINRLPSFLSNELFVDAQRRIVAMYETMDENFLPCDDYMLRFSERWVLLRRTEKQVLLVLGGEKANLASTRMVTNMTMKHLTPDIVSGLETAARGGFAAPASAGGNSLSSPPFGASSPQRFSNPPMPVPVASAASAPAAPAASAPVAVAEAAPAADHSKPVRMYRGRAY
jgi:hypothetical protein